MSFQWKFSIGLVKEVYFLIRHEACQFFYKQLVVKEVPRIETFGRWVFCIMAGFKGM